MITQFVRAPDYRGWDSAIEGEKEGIVGSDGAEKDGRKAVGERRGPWGPQREETPSEK